MKKSKLYILLNLIIVVLLYSCQTGSFVDNNLNKNIFINGKPLDNKDYQINYNDTIILDFSFNKQVNTSELIIEIPKSIICDIYFNKKYISSNKHELIFNAEEAINKDTNSIPITSSKVSVKINFKNKNSFNIDDKISFVIYKTIKNIKELNNIRIYNVDSKSDIPKQTTKTLTESSLPILIIETDTILNDTDYIFAEYKTYNNKKNIIGKNITQQGKLKIKIRGQSSQYYRKQSYKISTLKSKTSAKNIKLLGLPKENDWILYGPYWDKSLIRNNLAYQLWSEMGYYSPKTKYCELVINNDYRGIYVLTEKIKIDKKRFNLNKLSRKDSTKDKIDGGYIIKLDKGLKGRWLSNYSNNGQEKHFYYVSPSINKINKAQKEYIQEYMNNFETALKNNDNWKDYIYMQSFVDYLIINELAKNIDSYRLSTYLSKDKNEKLKIGPIWDFDRAFGNEDKKEFATEIDGFIYALKFVPFWWTEFINDKEFLLKLKNRYKELRKNILSDKNIIKIIDNNNDKVKQGINNNNIRWNTYEIDEGNPYKSKSLDESVKYLKDWTIKRAKYLDSAWK